MNKAIVLILTLVIAYNAHTQEIKKHYDENKMVSKVEFYSNGELKNTISLENPFNVTSYDSIDEGNGVIRYYINENDLNNLGDTFFKELSLNSAVMRLNRFNKISYKNSAHSLSDKYILIKQTLNAISENGSIEAVCTSGTLYDMNGNKVIEFKPSNKGILAPCVTENGKYIIFDTNFNVISDDLDPRKEISFDIYDLEKQKLIYSHVPERSIRFFRSKTAHNYFIINRQIERDRFKTLVIFPETLIGYYNYYTKKEAHSILRYEKNGIVFKSGKDGEIKERFTSMFSKKKL